MLSTKRSKFLLATAALIIFSIAAFYTHKQILQLVGDFLIIKDNLKPADIIYVIAGEDYRTEYAIALYKKGFGKMLFFTGGWCRQYKYYHGVHARKIALASDIPSDAIDTDDTTVTSTFAEILRLKAFIDRNPAGIHSIIVVSDPWHMRRTRWACRKIFGKTEKIQMAPVPFKATPYKKVWWTQEKSRAYVESEYIKTLYYYARYQFSRGALKRWLASLDKN